jgi:hypothetical protein
MLDIAILFLVSLFFILPWLYGTMKRRQEPDPYDNPDNWGDRP